MAMLVCSFVWYNNAFGLGCVVKRMIIVTLASNNGADIDHSDITSPVATNVTEVLTTQIRNGCYSCSRFDSGASQTYLFLGSDRMSICSLTVSSCSMTKTDKNVPHVLRHAVETTEEITLMLSNTTVT